jgi:hypothetical protein
MGVVLLALAVLLTASADASAKRIGAYHQVQALVPFRIYEQIGFVPIAGLSGTVKVRVGGDLYVGPWANTTASRKSLTQALTEVRRHPLTSIAQGIYADRKLTSAERRRFEVLVDIGRDADVLVVKQGHPACAGLTLAEVRGIASGRTTNWSQVASLPGASGAIALRHTVVDLAFEPRFGVAKKPSAAKGRRDGGIADAARDSSVAGVTSWSRARFRSGVCAVPIAGVVPSDYTVHRLTYAGAYPVTFVAAKKRARGTWPRTLLKLYVRFLKSEKAAKLFRGNGLVMAQDDPPPPGSPPSGGPGSGTGGPSQDAQGRPISPVRDDGAAVSALTGERLVTPDGGLRWVFEPDSVMRLLEASSGSCVQSNGRWTVLEGWRYSENGGGVIARVRTEFESASDHTIELPSATPDVAFVNGEQYSRSRSLSGTC